MPAGMPQRATALILACAFAALTSESQAIGFGRLGAAAVLGQPLNLPVPLRLEAGERLETDCIGAEVTAGETQFSRSQVRVRIEPRPGANEWVAIGLCRSAGRRQHAAASRGRSCSCPTGSR